MTNTAHTLIREYEGNGWLVHAYSVKHRWVRFIRPGSNEMKFVRF